MTNEYFKTDDIIIYKDDILTTEEIKRNSIDLIITSPPYNVDIGYNSHDDKMSYDTYLDFSENEIIMIIEHDKGGHMIEMGIILSFKEYLEKTKVFVLKNVEITEVLKRGGLLTPFFKEEKSLFMRDY